MSEWCKKCHHDMWGDDVEYERFNIKDNEVINILCEGCGQRWVDKYGNIVIVK